MWMGPPDPILDRDGSAYPSSSWYVAGFIEQEDTYQPWPHPEYIQAVFR